ncbi:uncharacterized protein LOC135481856 [Liolophura sinensis]|uniref:uncharacterized protein LOC135481856 n=1 Tax=Liolophura sinensis TaxID=3198878 RepID=UPI0031597976
MEALGDNREQISGGDILPKKKTKACTSPTLMNALIAYPVIEEDLEGPVIKPALSLTSSYYLKFISLRNLPKEGVLDLRFKTEELRKKAYAMLSDVKMCGESQPKILVSKQTPNRHQLLLSKAVDFVTKRTQDEEPAEPVSVFVNNIPFDARVEMLHFLYPTARSVQLPTNSQGGALGYAIVEFSNLLEANAVVKNNKEYPARIGDSYLNLHVIGHEEVREAPKPRIGAETKKTSVQVQKTKNVTESLKAQKRPGEKLGSLRQGSKQPRLSEKEGCEKKGAGPLSESSSNGSEKRRPSTTDDRTALKKDLKLFKVFIGNCPRVTAEELQDFLNKKMLAKGLCGEDERPVKRTLVVPDRKYQFAELGSATHAVAAIRHLNGIKFFGEKLVVEEAKTKEPLIREMELEKIEAQSRPKLFTLFIGNCPDVSAEEFQDFLNEELVAEGICGGDERPVKKVLVQAGRKYQFAEFESAKCALAAIKELNGRTFMGKKLNIQEGKNEFPLLKEVELEENEVRGGKIRRSLAARRAKPAKNYNVFIGNCQDTTADELRDFLNEQMAIEGICRYDDFPVKKTQVQKGRAYQFAVFCSASYAMAAIEQLNFVTFKGEKLKIKEGQNNIPLKEEAEREKAHLMLGGDESEESTIYIGNCPVATVAECHDFFTNLLRERGICGPTEHVVKRVKKKNSRDFQFIVFYEESHAIMAVEELNGVIFKGNELTIKSANKINKTNTQMDRPLDRPMDGSLSEFHWTPDFHQGFPQDISMVDTASEGFDVFVGNVPDTNCEELEEFFRREFIMRGLCNVKETPVKKIKFIANRQYQFVVFRSAAAAITAIAELNGVIFKGSKLKIKAGQNTPIAAPMMSKLANTRDMSVMMSNLANSRDMPTMMSSLSNTMDMPSMMSNVQNTRDMPAMMSNLANTVDMPAMMSNIANTMDMPMADLPGVPFVQNLINQAKSQYVPAAASFRQPTPSFLPHTISLDEDMPTKGYEVYFGNMPKAMRQSEELDLQQFIEREFIRRGLCGTNDRLVAHMKFEVGRAYQFVVFYNWRDAKAAIQELNGAMYQGHVLKVKEGLPAGKIPTVKPVREPRDRKPAYTPPRFEKRGPAPSKQVGTSDGFDVHVGNVPKCESAELKKFFMKQLLSLGLCDEGDKPIRGVRFQAGRKYQFINFYDESDAKAAVTVLDGLRFKGSQLNVGMGHQKSTRPENLQRISR